MNTVPKKVAVVLCGSGFKDGSEIRESVGVLWALSRHHTLVDCFAPNAAQKDVVNCLTMQPMSESRNMLVEAARIARGKIRDLTELNPANYDAIIIPGGFGAAKNLCDFAYKGSSGAVIPQLQEKLLAFYEAKKPIGAVCIAPAILALAFKNKKFQLTVGAAGEASAEIEKLGHDHKVCAPNETCIDIANKIYTTPAYMYDDAPLYEIFEGIDTLVKNLLSAA